MQFGKCYQPKSVTLKILNRRSKRLSFKTRHAALLSEANSIRYGVQSDFVPGARLPAPTTLKPKALAGTRLPAQNPRKLFGD
jgi:hypothetical protein